MPREPCGVPTPLGPCTMPAGHEATWHRHREYEGIVWKMVTRTSVIQGSGMNSLTNAISRNKSLDHKLVIEVICQ